MQDEDKSKEELIAELVELRQSIKRLEANQNHHEPQPESKDPLQDPKLMTTILDHLPAGIYVKDLKSRHLYANKRDLEIKQAESLNEVLNQTDTSFFDPAQAAQLLGDEQRIIETGEPLLDREESFTDRNGNTRWVLTTKLPWLDEQNQIKGIIGIGRDITRRKQDRDILNQINRRIIGADSFKAVLEQIVHGAMKLTKTETGVIFLVGEGPGGRRTIINDYRYPIDSKHPKPRIEARKGITYEVISTGEPVKIDDTQENDQSNPDVAETKIRSILGVPLIQDGQPIGVFFVNDTKPREFTNNEISQLTVMAGYAVTALRQAESHWQIESLYESSLKLSQAESAEAVFQMMTQLAPKATGADWVNLVLLDDTPPTMKLFDFPRHKKFTTDRVRLNGNSFRVFRDRQVYIVEDIDAQLERVNPFTHGRFKSLIGLPLIAEGDQCIGVIWLHYKHKRNFTKSQIQALRLYAAQGAIAYNNALHSEKIERITQMMRETMKVMLAGDKTKALNLIADGITKTIAGDAVVALYVYNSDLKALEYPPTLHGVKLEAEATRLERVDPESFVYKMLDRDKCYIAKDVTTDKYFHDRPFAKREKIRSALAVPLIALGVKTGVLFVNFRKPHQFSDDEIETIQMFAELAAVAIRNVQLHDRQRLNQITTLRKIAKTIVVESDQHKTLNGILDGIQHLMPDIVLADFRILDKTSGRLEPEAGIGITLDELSKVNMNVREGIRGWVAEHQKHIYVPDVKKDKQYYALSPVTQSELAVPLLEDKKLIGVLNVEHPKVNGFTESDIELIRAIAELTVVAYQNVERFQRIERDRRLQSKAVRQLAESIAATSQGSQRTLKRILEWINILAITDENESPCLIEILLLDEKTYTLCPLEILSGSNLEPRPVFTIEDDVFDWVIRQQEIRIIPDVEFEKIAHPVDSCTRSQLVVPIIRDNRPFGIINIEHPRVDAFPVSFIELAKAIANLVLVAIDHAKQYEDLKKAKQMIDARTALAWLNLASATWFHDIIREVSTIRNNIDLAEGDLRRKLYNNFVDRLHEINLSVQEILDMKEMMPHDLATDLSSYAVHSFLEGLFKRFIIEKAAHNLEFTYKLEILENLIISVNSEWLKKLLEILVNNSIDAIGEANPNRRISFHTIRDDDYVAIDVTDTGRGMPPEIVAILESGKPIYPKENKPGLGMGLLVAQFIAEAFGGHIKVKNTSSIGTTVSIRLPITLESF